MTIRSKTKYRAMCTRCASFIDVLEEWFTVCRCGSVQIGYNENYEERNVRPLLFIGKRDALVILEGIPKEGII